MNLNLGCGVKPKRGYLNVDARIPPGYEYRPRAIGEPTHIVHEVSGDAFAFACIDLEKHPWPWHNDKVQRILASHLLEHLDDVVAFMDEAHRVLRPGGSIEIRVPHYQHPNAHQDPTHQRTFTPRSMTHFLHDAPEGANLLGTRRWTLTNTRLNGGWETTPPWIRSSARKLHNALGWDLRRYPAEIEWHLTPAQTPDPTEEQP